MHRVTNRWGYVATTSPELQYSVTLPSAGTWYVWLRGYGTNTANESAHVGIDGTADEFANRVYSPERTSIVGTLNDDSDEDSGEAGPVRYGIRLALSEVKGISEAEVAQTTYTAFAGTRHEHTARPHHLEAEACEPTVRRYRVRDTRLVRRERRPPLAIAAPR